MVPMPLFRIRPQGLHEVQNPSDNTLSTCRRIQQLPVKHPFLGPLTVGAVLRPNLIISRMWTIPFSPEEVAKVVRKDGITLH
jgi:hypothetical protein